jgi:hypothetical protein
LFQYLNVEQIISKTSKPYVAHAICENMLSHGIYSCWRRLSLGNVYGHEGEMAAPHISQPKSSAPIISPWHFAIGVIVVGALAVPFMRGAKSVETPAIHQPYVPPQNDMFNGPIAIRPLTVAPKPAPFDMQPPKTAKAPQKPLARPQTAIAGAQRRNIGCGWWPVGSDADRDCANGRFMR